MKFLFVLLILWGGVSPVLAQNVGNQRSSLHFLYGLSGANIREFSEMLEGKGISPMRKGYNSFGVAYQTRFNDFVVGLELTDNNGPASYFQDYRLDFQSTRLYLNIGYSFTEEGEGIQLVHYMSLGVGYLNFEMLKEVDDRPISEFLDHPQQGFIIRQRNLHKGSQYMGGFLTEIGFQLSKDLPIPGKEEAVELVAKFGYSFTPFENSWNNKGVSFDNTQSGAFLRIGAGIALPERNYFYRDATLRAQFFYGRHFTKPQELNNSLQAAGYTPFSGQASNMGLKITGENRGMLYGIDFYNLSQKGRAKDNYLHTLNSVRIYGNLGRKLYEWRNFEIGTLGGIGLGSTRYTLEHTNKPDFPALFEEPDFDGTLKTRGLMFKPEAYIAYAMPFSSVAVFDLIYSLHAGYEVPLGRFELANLDMKKYMGGPYIQVGIGIIP